MNQVFKLAFLILSVGSPLILNSQWLNAAANDKKPKVFKAYVIYPRYDAFYPGQICTMELVSLDGSLSHYSDSHAKISEGNGKKTVTLTYAKPFYLVDKERPRFEYKYYDKDDSELYEKINRGETIKDAYIEEFDFGKLINPTRSSDSQKIIDKRIDFAYCIINRIIIPRSFESTLWLIPTKEPTVDSLYFEKPITFSECFLKSTLAIRHAIFKDTFLFSNIYSNSYSMFPVVEITRSRFEKEFFLNDYNLSGELRVEQRDSILNEYMHAASPISAGNARYGEGRFKFYMNTFEGNCHIFNGTKFYHFYFDESTFLGTANFCRYTNTVEDNNIFGVSPRYAFIKTEPRLKDHSLGNLRNVSANNCSFKTLNLENTFINNCSFKYSLVRDSLIVYNCRVDSNANLANLSINNADRVTLIASVDTGWLRLGLPPSSYELFSYPYVAHKVNEYTIIEKQKMNDFYSQLRQALQQKFSNSPEHSEELRNRLIYDRELYCRDYYAKNGMYGSLLWSSVLNWTVNYGYHGEFNFFITSGIVILFFAAVYFIFFRRQTIRYVNMISYKSIGKQKYPATVSGRTFLRCIWVSFLIFVNPKMPLLYFQVRKRLFTFFMIEWIVGTFLMVLFLIFIVSKYPFIKMLFG